MKFRNIAMRIAAVVIATAAVLCAEAQNRDKAGDRETGGDSNRRFESVQQQRKLLSVYNYLNSIYVDRTDMAPLVEKAIKSMIEELDPHSSYIPAEDMKGVREQLDGEFSGIGVEFNMYRDTILVVNVVAGAPAESVGIRPNDRIVAIDGEDAIGISRSDVTKKLRGKTGTKVAVDVVRHGTDGRLEFTIVRGKIPINTVDAFYLIDKNTGYIKVNRFSYTTMNEFEQAVKDMGGIKSLIVDLRGNGGGIMDQAVKMSEFFLPSGSLIVSTEGANVASQQIESRHNGKFVKGNAVILIDGSSASASEIFSGAMQDWDRAVIIGSPSYGKGLVQRQMMLPDSSAVRITIARYHTPTGRVIQRPYEKGKREEYFEAHRERLANGSADSPADGERPEYKTLRNGRTVYGGGGITPDIIIAPDTTMVTDCVVKLTAKGLIIESLYNYLDRSREELSAEYRTFDKFESEFEVSPQLIGEILAAGAEQGIDCGDGERADTERFIKRLVKGYVARMLFSNNEYWRIMNESGDPVYRKAVEIIGDADKMKELLSADNQTRREN